jgi:rod shape-determining protein MreC
VLALLLLTAFTLITLDYRAQGGGFFGSLRRTASSVFGPVERIAADVVRPVRHAVQAIGSIGSNHKQVQQLQKEISALREQVRQQPFDKAKAAELDRLLHVSSVGQYKLVPAQVIAVGAGQGFEWTATIDAGSIDGIKPNMTVLNGDGLVGRVKVVGSTTSTVVLCIDPQFNVGVRLPAGQMGVVSGHGKSPMTLQLLDPSARVKPDDGLVTQGSAGQTPFVWGVPVGRVVTATSPLAGDTQTGTVQPFVSFTSLDLVGVVVEPPRKDPRGALLQSPVPTVTVTATATVTPTPLIPSSASPGTTATGTARASSTARATATRTPVRTPTPTPAPKPTPKPPTPTPPTPSVSGSP